MEKVTKHFNERLTNECLDLKEEAQKEEKHPIALTTVNDICCSSIVADATTATRTGAWTIPFLATQKEKVKDLQTICKEKEERRNKKRHDRARANDDASSKPTVLGSNISSPAVATESTVAGHGRWIRTTRRPKPVELGQWCKFDCEQRSKRWSSNRRRSAGLKWGQWRGIWRGSRWSFLSTYSLVDRVSLIASSLRYLHSWIAHDGWAATDDSKYDSRATSVSSIVVAAVKLDDAAATASKQTY